MKTALLVIIFAILILYLLPASLTTAQVYCPAGGNIKVNPTEPALLTTSKDLPDANNIFESTYKCITGNRATIDPFSIKDYATLKSVYFDQNKVANKIIKPPADQPAADQIQNTPTDVVDLRTQNSMYHIRGNFTINPNVSIAVDKTGVIFVDGNLIIKGDQTSTTATAGLVFVVRDNVYINLFVRQVNAVIVTYGKFCSWAPDPVNPSNCGPNPTGTPNSDLTINGSVIALSTDTSKQPLFGRKLANNTTLPSEKINFDPKFLIN